MRASIYGNRPIYIGGLFLDRALNPKPLNPPCGHLGVFDDSVKEFRQNFVSGTPLVQRVLPFLVWVSAVWTQTKEVLISKTPCPPARTPKPTIPETGDRRGGLDAVSELLQEREGQCQPPKS